MKVQFPEGRKSYLTRLETRMDPEAMTEDIWLMPAAQPKKFQVSIQATKNLMDAIDVNAKTTDGWTTLMRAVRYNNNPDVISMLLEAGARVNAKNKDGKTAFDYAQHNARLKGTDAYVKLREAQY